MRTILLTFILLVVFDVQLPAQESNLSPAKVQVSPAASEGAKPLPDIEGVLSAWRTFMVGFAILHYVIGVAGAICATVVATKTTIISKRTNTIFAWTSAVCVSLLTLFAPLKKGKMYHSAWTDLSTSYTQYLTGGKVTEAEIRAKRWEGERVVGGFFE